MRRLPRILSLLLTLAVLLATGLVPSAAAYPSYPNEKRATFQFEDQYAPPTNVNAEFAVVVEGSTGELLYAKNPHGRAAPASMTKIVTAMVALERGNLTDIVKVSVDSKRMEDETNSSVMGLMPGEEISLEALLYGLIMPSGNDAAIAIAEHIAGSEKRFVDLMNERVRELGFNNTHFVNTHGLDSPNHYTTAYEITMLGRIAMRNPAFAKIVGTKRITVSGKQKKYFLENNSPFLWNYPGADGVKMGYTLASKQSIVGSAVRNDRRLFVGLIRSNNRFLDSQILLDYFFSQPEPTSTPLPTPTFTPTPVPTSTPTFTPSPTPTPTSTSTPTTSPTPTPTPEPSKPGQSSAGGRWYEALLGLPWKALRSAFSFIGRILPQ